MSVINNHSSLLEDMSKMVSTGVAEETLSDRSVVDEVGWRAIVDGCLIEWGNNPGPLIADEIQPPSKIAVRRAVSLMQDWRDGGIAAPTRCIPNGNGGIVFQWTFRNGNKLRMDIAEDGSVDAEITQGGVIVKQEVFVA